MFIPVDLILSKQTCKIFTIMKMTAVKINCKKYINCWTI